MFVVVRGNSFRCNYIAIFYCDNETERLMRLKQNEDSGGVIATVSRDLAI